jgi:hypothetical protein
MDSNSNQGKPITQHKSNQGTYHMVSHTIKSLYTTLISNGVAHMNKQLWKLKVPLKIKTFMWYMSREVVLTKDNLARQIGMVEHNVASIYGKSLYNTFFYCLCARFLWGLVQITFSISPPQSIQQLFAAWKIKLEEN